ncbi:MAG TPA: DUF4381 domain-containing protein [Dokdonella sp.]|uniref:DUF4381 domain-containing protein n=1 Tax=Dokdonella sp. TaxID=2291710 RepID=UPI002D7F633C|nr:DUF4381 domain-containing protein [Dokdonella sp.]HET9032195.1 DUF4381 domain-containing protein [Dokdonella sp.]
MNPTGPELRDIHLPADPSWWPPAPGWWILAALVIGLTLWFGFWMRRRLRRRQWRQRIMLELDRIAANDSLKSSTPALTAALSQLLRRAGRIIRPDASSLRGKAWLEFLDSIVESDEFSNGPGCALLEGPYQRESKADHEALIELVRRWMKRALDDRVPHV